MIERGSKSVKIGRLWGAFAPRPVVSRQCLLPSSISRRWPSSIFAVRRRSSCVVRSPLSSSVVRCRLWSSSVAAGRPRSPPVVVGFPSSSVFCHHWPASAKSGATSAKSTNFAANFAGRPDRSDLWRWWPMLPHRPRFSDFGPNLVEVAQRRPPMVLKTTQPFSEPAPSARRPRCLAMFSCHVAYAQ